ncbi:T9SS type A sorting domain-containing protein [Bacteroidota bacterium]
MKAEFKFFLTAIFIFMTSISYNQSINSLATIPVNPTVNDQVKTVCSSTHPNTGCEIIYDTISINGNIISVTAMHASGMMPAICNTTDTIDIGGFLPGNYTVVYEVRNQIMSTIGVDTTYFSVILSTNINDLQSSDRIKIFPNPSNGSVSVELKTDLNNGLVKLFDIRGKLITSYEVRNEQKISLNSNLLPGVYFVFVSDENGLIENRKLIIY